MIISQPEMTTSTTLGFSEFGRNRIYRIVYANIVYFIVMHGGPLVLLAFLNTRLIMALKAQETRKRKMFSSNTGLQVGKHFQNEYK